MSTVSASSDAADRANAWLAAHHDELRSRARVQFAGFDPDLREDCTCELLAIIAASVHSAAQRGTLDKLSPSTCCHYAVKQVKGGRKAAGYTSTDALAEATWLKHGIHITSLETDFDLGSDKPVSLHEALADRDAEPPVEVVRRQHDLGLALSSNSVSRKARQVFVALAESAGKIKQKELAFDLGVTAGRLTQIKGELASTLSAFGYASPLGQRPTRG